MKKLLAICLGLVIILGACGNKDKDKDNDTDNDTDGKIKLGKYLKENNTVAYSIEPSTDGQYNKNEEITAVHFTKNGKIKSYNVMTEARDSDEDTKYLGDVSKMSNKELISWAEKADKNAFEKNKSRLIENREDDLEYRDLTSEGRKNANKALDFIKNTEYKKPQYTKINLSGEEDGTGNNLEEEAINIAPQYMYTNISAEKVANHVKANKKIEGFNTGSINSVEVYDKQYSGWFKQDSEGDVEKGLIIEIGDKTEGLELDDTDDVKIS